MKRFIYLSLISLLMLPSLHHQTVYAKEEMTQGIGQERQDRGNDSQFSIQEIYVPYENLNEALQKKEKGVLIPYSDFLRLWEKASKKPPSKAPPVPPVDAAIIHSEYKGKVLDDIAEFEAELKISALKEKWAKLHLNIKDIAITSLSLNGKTPLLKPVKGGLELILPEKGEYILKVNFSAQVNTSPGEKFIHFRVPSSPLTKIDMTVPGKDLDVKIEPMLSKKSNVDGDNTKFSAFLAPGGDVNIRWLAKTTDTKVTRSLIFAKLLNEVNIKESVYLINTKINFSIMQAETDSFQVKIPKALSLVRVDGKNIKDWEMSEEGVLTVNLYEKIDGQYILSVSTEKYRDLEENSFEIPQFEVLNAKREEGEIIIKAEPSLRVQVEKKDRVTQIDPKELQGRVTFNELVSAFKYFRRPFHVSLNISKIQPKITAEQNVFISFSETIIDYYTNVKFTVKDAGLFKFRFIIPDNFRIVEVGSDQTVDSFDVSKEKDQNILTVILKNKAYANFLLPIHLEADKEDKDVVLALPKVQCLDAEKEEGIITLSLRKNLKLSTDDMKSLRPISLEELKSQGTRDPDIKNEIAAGYRYATPDYSCRLKIDKRKTKIIASVERNIDVEEAVMKINDVIRYNILYAPTSLFRIELPAAIAKDVIISGNNIKEKRLAVNEEIQKGVWTIELHSPTLNNFDLNVSFEKKLPSIKTGDERIIEVPGIRVIDVFNETGYISVSKSPDLQVEAKEKNLDPVDSKEIPAAMNRSQSVLAFRYLSHPYALSLETTKHEYEKILDAVVNQAHFDIVVSNEGVAKTEGVFRIQNTNRQSLELTMPEGIDKIYSVFISGKKAGISKGGSDRSKIIMLPKDIAPGKEFTLRIIYQTQIKSKFGFWGGLHVKGAEIMDIPCSKITWRLYLPNEYSYLYLKGSINPGRDEHRAYNHVNAAVQSRRVHHQTKINLTRNQIPQQTDEGTLYGLDIEMVREGRMFSFSKLDKNAYLNVCYLKKNIMFPLSIIIVVLSTFYFITLTQRKDPNKTKMTCAIIGAVIALYVILPQGFKHFMFLMLVGVVFSGVVLVIQAYRKKKKMGLNAETNCKTSVQKEKKI
ncbi:MAG: hypothetical protein K8S27_04735 [Candidatus Omnitrophica bacterium]|nr:hypothetical protein [Candidatus Omnitrophota bacterium]